MSVFAQWMFGTLLAVVGLVMAWYFWQVNNKKPRWASRKTTLVDDFQTRLPEVKVSYRDETVRNLSVTRIIFWNAGFGTIKRDDLDVGDDHHLCLAAPDGVTILDANIVSGNNPAVAPTIHTDESRRRVKISFRYLDRNQGLVVRLVHTGGRQSNIQVQGLIQGVSQIRQVTPELYPAAIRSLYRGAGLDPRWSLRRNWADPIITGLLPLVAVAFFAVETNHWSSWAFAAAFIPVSLYSFRRFVRERTRDIPEGLEAFVDDG